MQPRSSPRSSTASNQWYVPSTHYSNCSMETGGAWVDPLWTMCCRCLSTTLLGLPSERPDPVRCVVGEASARCCEEHAP